MESAGIRRKKAAIEIRSSHSLHPATGTTRLPTVCRLLLLEPEAWKLCKPCFVTPVQGLSFDQVLLTAASGKRVARREEPIRDFCAGALVTWPVSWTKRWGLEGSAGLRCCRK